MMEKLSSDITDAKIDSLLTLVSQCDHAKGFVYRQKGRTKLHFSVIISQFLMMMMKLY